jgi:hypothetical protein
MRSGCSATQARRVADPIAPEARNCTVRVEAAAGQTPRLEIATPTIASTAVPMPSIQAPATYRRVLLAVPAAGATPPNGCDDGSGSTGGQAEAESRVGRLFHVTVLAFHDLRQRYTRIDTDAGGSLAAMRWRPSSAWLMIAFRRDARQVEAQQGHALLEELAAFDDQIGGRAVPAYQLRR